MKTKKIIKIIVTATFLVSAICFAQMGGSGGPQPPNAEDMVANLAEKLSLTEDQQSAILELFTEQFEEMEELRESGDMESGREKMDELREEMDKKIKALLTEEQIEIYEEMQNSRPQPGQGPPKN